MTIRSLNGVDYLHYLEKVKKSARLHRPVRRRVPTWLRRYVGRQIRKDRRNKP